MGKLLIARRHPPKLAPNSRSAGGSALRRRSRGGAPQASRPFPRVQGVRGAAVRPGIGTGEVNPTASRPQDPTRRPAAVTAGHAPAAPAAVVAGAAEAVAAAGRPDRVPVAWARRYRQA